MPVDSAISCSSQAPSRGTLRDVENVTLSRPTFAAAPRIAPSSRPGFSPSGVAGPQSAAISAPRSSSALASIPTSAAGTIPKSESAEKRPPTLGTPWKTRRKPFARATPSIAEPGSVIATKRSPAFDAPSAFTARSKK